MTSPLPPGATIGILGGGQLGRMTALAASDLGYKCHIFSPDADAPAKEVSGAQTTAPYEDLDAARKFAQSVDVVTFEFENVPDDVLAVISELSPVRPSADALHVSQDRQTEKAFINRLGIALHLGPGSETKRPSTPQPNGISAVLKTARLGYDGKGQVRSQIRSRGGLD